MKLKDVKTPNKRNPVAKNMGINRASTHKDKKKSLNTPRKNKYKDKLSEGDNKQWTKDEIRQKLLTDDK